MEAIKDIYGKEFKLSLLRFETLLAIFGMSYVIIMGFSALSFTPPSLWWLACLVLFPAIFFLSLVIWILRSTKVILFEDHILYHSLGKTIHVKWSEILSLQRQWTIYAGYTYLIKTKKGKIGFPESVKGYEEILNIIKEKTGKGPVSEWKTAKQDVREEWQGLIRWIKSNPLQTVVVVCLIAGGCYFAVRWVIALFR